MLGEGARVREAEGGDLERSSGKQIKVTELFLVGSL